MSTPAKHLTRCGDLSLFSITTWKNEDALNGLDSTMSALTRSTRISKLNVVSWLTIGCTYVLKYHPQRTDQSFTGSKIEGHLIFAPLWASTQIFWAFARQQPQSQPFIA